MGQTAISCTDRKRPGSLPELQLTDRPKGTLQKEMGGHKLCPQQALLGITSWRNEQLRTKEFHEQRVEERAYTEASR
jgi:hypothetical protein